MASPKNRFVYETLQDGAVLADYLRALADGVARGQLSFSASDDEIVLEPQGLMRLRIKAARGSQRSRLSLRLSWRAARADLNSHNAPLHIAAGPARPPAE